MCAAPVPAKRVAAWLARALLCLILLSPQLFLVSLLVQGRTVSLPSPVCVLLSVSSTSSLASLAARHESRITRILLRRHDPPSFSFTPSLNHNPCRRCRCRCRSCARLSSSPKWPPLVPLSPRWPVSRPPTDLVSDRSPPPQLPSSPRVSSKRQHRHPSQARLVSPPTLPLSPPSSPPAPATLPPMASPRR